MATQFIIYQLTNVVNNKIYIGKTKRRLCNRLADHRYFSKKHKKQPISRAIAKYGWESFEVSILQLCQSEEEMNLNESLLITQKNSINPNVGYNVCSEIQDHRFSNSEYFKELEKYASQGRKSYNSKCSKYVGTRFWNGDWYCQCCIDGKNISKKCKDEIDAAETYDKICLFHYGQFCKINFENKREIYLLNNLKEIFEWFVDKTHSSSEKFICYDKSRMRWVYSRIINGKKIFKRFRTENDAITFKKQIESEYELRKNN